MVDQAKAVGAAAKQAGVKHLVSVGSLGSGKRGNRLQEWYDDAEKAIDMSKVPRTFVRCLSLLFSVYTSPSPTKPPTVEGGRFRSSRSNGLIAVAIVT